MRSLPARVAATRCALALAGLAGLGAAGCAATGADGAPGTGPGWAHTPAGQPLAPQAALAAIVVGRSTPEEIRAALGPAIVVSFDSGWAVWAYRWPGADGTPRSATELVVLFAPAGVATKVRLRPGYPPARTTR
ncbi:MAG TPA: hypothetical protein VFX50_16510 [Gemmatimonadales bacterium]|nr:hypothetical protein [Gemmatimonadales bacterium]